MLVGVGKTLHPYFEDALNGILPIILLHSYHCLVMAWVVEAVQEFDVDIESISSRYASLFQLVVVGIEICKPLKANN